MARRARRKKRSVRWGRLAFWMIVTVGLLYTAPMLYLYLFQRSFVFVPGDELETPEDKGLAGVTVLTKVAPDGTELLAWYAEPEGDNPSVLYLHGNARNISSRADRFQEVLDAGYGLLAPSYRGYPGSGGSPSEDALISDAFFWLDWLQEEQGGPVILHGESLGSGIAIAVAADRDVGAVVLEAPYTATVDIASDAYPWLPVSLLMKDQFRSRDRIGSVSEPVLIVHGTDDQVIPYRHGVQINELANDPKAFVSVPGATHSNLWDRGLWGHVVSFLDEQLQPAATQ